MTLNNGVNKILKENVAAVPSTSHPFQVLLHNITWFLLLFLCVDDDNIIMII